MSGCTARGAYVVGLILAFAAAATAHEDDNRSEPPRTPYYSYGGSTLIFLLTKPGVQEELGLGESKSKSLAESLREIDPKHSSFRTPEESQRVREMSLETTRQTEAAIQKSLSKEQFRRFQQLGLQHLGGRALYLVPETAQQLALTTEQRKKIETIREEFRLAGAKEITEKFESDLLTVLTPDQTNQWKEMTGVPFKIPEFFGGPSWGLVRVPEVQKELGLSEDEVATLEQSLSAIQREGYGRTFGSNRAGRSEVDVSRQSQQILDTAMSSLTVSQWNRLQELILQNTGVESLAHHEVANTLGLSREQRDRVSETMKEYRRGVTEDRTLLVKPKELQTRKDKEQADLLDILTPEQKNQWEAMKGTKVDPDRLRRPRISAAGK